MLPGTPQADYLTPQSQHVMEDGMGGAMMNVNVQQAMKVRRPPRTPPPRTPPLESLSKCTHTHPVPDCAQTL
jgi:hypothetical protein